MQTDQFLGERPAGRTGPAPSGGGTEFEIGVCDPGFHVFARIVLRGADGVRRMESNLAELGYRALSSDSPEQLCGCDLLMVRGAAQAKQTRS
jgi:hypothetical protein